YLATTYRITILFLRKYITGIPINACFPIFVLLDAQLANWTKRKYKFGMSKPARPPGGHTNAPS
ncbi:MAG: hypothetical protein LBF40_07505, partial [Deltaproteobacteria bacterium]|nr:hypothetical protein [Deltaproteobacteria bacterium]